MLLYSQQPTGSTAWHCQRELCQLSVEGWVVTVEQCCACMCWCEAVGALSNGQVCVSQHVFRLGVKPSQTALSRCASMRSPFLGPLEDVPAGLSVGPTLQSMTQRPCILPAQLHGGLSVKACQAATLLLCTCPPNTDACSVVQDQAGAAWRLPSLQGVPWATNLYSSGSTGDWPAFVSKDTASPMHGDAL